MSSSTRALLSRDEPYVPSSKQDDISIELGAVREFEAGLSEAFDLTIVLDLYFTVDNLLAGADIWSTEHQ